MGRLIDAELIDYIEINGGYYADKDEVDKIPPLEAIPKDQYEARLKADMVAMLEEIESMFWELTKNKYDMQILYEKADDFEADFNSFIQQKIDKLKENK